MIIVHFNKVVPNVMSICIFSPLLDDIGNSVKGIEVCKRLVDKYHFHIFENIVSEKLKSVSLEDHSKEVLLQKLITAASNNDIEIIKKLDGLINFNKGDYDKRTALHLASSEGHVEIVNYLLSNGCIKDVKDRWGNTPLSEIKDKIGDNYAIINELLTT